MKHRVSRRLSSTLPMLVIACLLTTRLPAQIAGVPPQRGATVVSDPVPDSDVDVTAAADWPHIHRLLSSTGRTLHQSDKPIHNLATATVPGARIHLYTWDEEQPSGDLRHYYAYSADGAALSGRVRVTDYLVRLVGHDFDPLENTPSIDNELRARGNNQLFLVQFRAAPLPEFAALLVRLGGRVHRFLTDHTYLVEIRPDVARWLSKLDIVRWTGPYHPAYRLAPELHELAAGAAAAPPRPERYSILLLERGRIPQDRLSAFVRRIGGRVDVTTPEGLRLEATLTPRQLLELVHRNDVQYVDPWGGPGETDMDVVRAVGGANFIESTLGFTGQGVRGEIFDTELLTTHQEWGPSPIIHSSGTTGGLHGTSCYSINFATGVDASSRGMCPDGQGVFFRYSESTQFGGSTSRYVINQQLLDPFGAYRCVFQTSSVGSARTTAYTTISAETDDYLFLHQVLSTQSQSNAGNQNSRPQAWAKNIVSCGGVYHFGTSALSDDRWNGGASIGPAADGRIKPDLAYFYDGIRSATGSGNASYTGFGGTSAATPETAGHFGIFFQMWHGQTWTGFGGAASVFDSRPEMATAKAMLINHAHRYDWNGGGSNSDIDRYKQGWGLADLQQLYDDRDAAIIIDETDILAPLASKTYDVTIDAGTTELRATLVFVDPMGTPGASQARVNDLSLRVTSPAGTVYWGNNGLTSSNASSPGGSSNTIDTVENVFVPNPTAGDWTVEVLADEVVQDGHLETPSTDADYALVVVGARPSSGGGGPPTCTEAPIPAYQRTYSSSSRTRGLWFTAPTDFDICGLQVPDELGHGLQNVEVVRFNGGAPPPNWSTTTNNFTSLFRATGVSSATVIQTAIPVRAGEVIGILGAAGDSSIMRNSYGSATFTSNIDGQTMTLRRLGMQANLVTSAAANLYTSSSNLARVRFWYTVGGGGGPQIQELDIAPYARTYSNGTRTRGYWFTCPANISIRSLRVPDEQGHGLQNVEIVRFNSGVAPPQYSATTNAFTSLFRATGAAAGQRIQVDLPINAGDVIGILGAAGDASIMHNSYGDGPHSTSILGQPVTLGRMGMQFNLASNAARDLWSQASNSIGRVEVEYVAR